MAYRRWLCLFLVGHHRIRNDDRHLKQSGHRLVSHNLISTSTPAILTCFYPSNALAGIGFSSPLILIISLVQLSTPPLYIGITSALVISARTLGGTVGLAIAEVIYAAKTNSQVPEAIGKWDLSFR